MSALTDNDTESSIDAGYRRGNGSYDPNAIRSAETAYAQAGIDQAEAFANDPNNATQSVENGEVNPPNPMNFTGSGGQKQKVTGKAWFKKKGPMALIVGLLLGGGAGVTFLLSPGLGIVQFKEILTKDLNDQLAAMDIRQYHVFKAKLKTMKATFGICSGPVNIRCKFSSMSGTQIKKFQNASFEIECEKMPCSTSPFSRNKIKSITFPDDSEALKDPGKFIDKARSSTAHASALNKAYNPKFAGLADAIATKFFNSRGLSKKPIITENSEEENRKSLKEAVKNGVKETSISTATANEKDDEKTKAAKEASAGMDEAFKENVDKVTQTGVKAAEGGVRGAAKGIGILGAADTTCSIWRTGVAIESGAKKVRGLQLARYAISFLSVADAIKAGKATPKQVEFVGNTFTSTDTNKELADKTPNPFYGKNAFDSPGYKVAAYNEAPKLTARSQQYTIGGTGGLLGALSGVNGAIANLGAAPKATCGVIQNPLTRIGSFVVGIGIGAVTLGGSLAVSVGASATLGIALGIAEDVLTNMLAGTVVDDNTKGVESGDAMFAGTAALLGGVAQSRGLSPLTEQGIKEYSAVRQESENKIAAVEKYDAQATPFDVNNQYTFVGSLARNVGSIASSSNSFLANLGSILTQPFTSMKASALADTYNPERYKQCDDTAYKDMNLAPDVFCNLRYGLSDAELAMDTDQVLEYMIANGHIDEETGDPKSEDFKNYVTYCTNREEPLGSMAEEPDANPEVNNMKEGRICSNQEQKYQNFRVYLLDKSISDGMDDEPEGQQDQSSTTENSGNVNPDGWSFPTTAGAAITSPFGMRTLNGVTEMHNGVDLGVGSGSPFYATRDGVVTTREYDIKSIAGKDGVPGSWCTVTPSESPIQKDIWITHMVDGQKYVSVYGHMSKFLKKTGDQVKAGDLIGYTGGSGCSTGPHVHFEIWKGEAFGGQAINPAPLISK